VVLHAGESRLRWNIFSSAPGSAAVVRGGVVTHSAGTNEYSSVETSLLGWESFTYGDLRPAVSLLYNTRSQLPVRFVTAVLTEEDVKLDTIGGQVVIYKDKQGAQLGTGAEIYRVSFRDSSPPATNSPANVLNA
jgi:hypothetical protein